MSFDQDARILYIGHHLKVESLSYVVLVQPTPQDIFPWKNVWKSKVPLRVAFFIWTAALGKILTTDNLRKQRVIILDWCCMCKLSGESVNHLLMHCSVAWELWNLILILFGDQWAMPRDVVDLLTCWNGSLGKSKACKIWKMIPHCLMWCLWCERNARTFNGKAKSIPALKFHFIADSTWLVEGLSSSFFYFYVRDDCSLFCLYLIFCFYQVTSCVHD